MSRYSDLEATGVELLRSTFSELPAENFRAIAYPGTDAPPIIPYGEFFWIPPTRVTNVESVMGVVRVDCETDFGIVIYVGGDQMEKGDGRIEAFTLLDRIRPNFIGWQPTLADVINVFPAQPREWAVWDLDGGGYSIEYVGTIRIEYQEAS